MMKRSPALLRILAPAFACLLIAVFVAQSVGQTSDNKASFRVATYNVENMFDVFDDPYTQDEDTQVKSRKSIKAIAAAIKSIDADVVAFQEIENDGIIQAMLKEFLPDSGYTYTSVTPTNSTRGINLGIISRKPILSVTSYRWRELTLPGETRTWKFARDLLHARIQATPSSVVDVFVVHLKSKRDSHGDPRSAKWRLAEATMARKIIEERILRDPNAMVVLVGDYNDEPDSQTLAQLLHPGKDGQRILIDLHAKLPKEKRGTYLRGQFAGTTIDYITANPKLAQHVKEDGVAVVQDDTLTSGADHAPLYATFMLPK